MEAELVVVLNAVSGGRMFELAPSSGRAGTVGLHVIATGAVITQKQARMNAAFVQTMHKHFDHALGQATLDKIWDPGFTSLQIPGTTKNNSLDMDTAYAGHIASVDDMITFLLTSQTPSLQLLARYGVWHRWGQAPDGV
eukprot:COSAG02_NODE_3935_length_6022_cov_102.607294_5_plen_139_part_00